MKAHSEIVILWLQQQLHIFQEVHFEENIQGLLLEPWGGGVCEMPHYLNLRLSRDR